MKTRASSKQVDDVLQRLATSVGWEQSLLAAICRDWLDMGDRLAAAERVVEAARAYRKAEGDHAVVVAEYLDLIVALDDYAATTTGSAE